MGRVSGGKVCEMQSETKPSPAVGSWEADGMGSTTWVLTDAGVYLAEMVDGDDEGLYEPDDDARFANALLMAAAPDLLGAVRAFLAATAADIFTDAPECQGQVSLVYEAQDLAHAAIARAEGGV